MKKKMNDSGKSKLVLTILTAVCVVLIILSFTTDAVSGPLHYVTGVITPIQSGMNAIGTWISDKGEYLFHTTDLRSENAGLQKKVDELTAENSDLLQNQDEYERLKDLLDLKDEYSNYPTIAARIIAKDSGNWFNVFTINKGSKDGIQEDMNVIADGGLVGIVTSVGSNWATVRSIIDDYSNVSAEISSTSDNCIIAGNLKLIDEGKISLVKLTDADNKVTVGDKVVTSEISNRFLPGILIGYVSEIGMDSNNLTKSGSITPVVDFRHLHEVLVITQLKNTDEAQKDIQSQAQSETEMILETETGKQTESRQEENSETQSHNDYFDLTDICSADDIDADICHCIRLPESSDHPDGFFCTDAWETRGDVCGCIFWYPDGYFLRTGAGISYAPLHLCRILQRFLLSHFL